MELAEFGPVLEETYASFRRHADLARLNGLGPDPSLMARTGGIFVSLKHSPEFARKIESMSRRISSVVPAVVYRAGVVHTTLAGTGFVKGGQIDTQSPVAKDRIAAIVRAMRRTVKDMKGARIEIQHPRYLFTQHAVVAEGRPNQAFLDLVCGIRAECLVRGVEIREPKSAHITLSRFTGRVDPDRLGDFLRLMNTPGPGTSRGIGVSVGYSLWREGDPLLPGSNYGHAEAIDSVRVG